jgi:Glycosyl transferases group 1
MLYCYPIDVTGCGSYRLQFVVDALPDDLRARTTVIRPGADGGLEAHLRNDEVHRVDIPSDCTGVVLQRPTNYTLVSCIPYIQRAGLPVIIDIDDDLAAANPRHPVWYALHPRPGVGAPDQDWNLVVKACKAADLVTVSTPLLLDKYAAHGRGCLLRNCVPERFFTVEAQDPVQAMLPHVGWAGGMLGHPDDLTALGPALAQLRQCTGTESVPVRIIGPRVDPEIIKVAPRFDPARTLGVPEHSIEYTGSIPFTQWIANVKTIHTGIAPLYWERFNFAKSWLKPLEYSAAGVPFVATPTPEYEALGAGLLARKPQHWKAHLRRLLTDALLRYEEIERNLAIAREHTYERHWKQWWTAWESVGAV